MPIETSITQSIINYVRQIGGQAEKVKGDSSASGRPDINACYKGRCLRIEVKTPDNRNKASKKQEINLKRWNRAGAIVMVVYSKKAVQYFINHINHSIGEVYFMTYHENNNCVSECHIPYIPRERQ